MKQIIQSLPNRITERIIRIGRWEEYYEIEYSNENNEADCITGNASEVIAHLKKIFKSTKSSQAEICETAINMVCAEYYITADKLTMKTRKREIVEARQTAMALVYHRFRNSKFISLQTIGANIGNKDHATVIHASKSVNNLCDTNKEYNEMFQRLTNDFNEITKYEN